MRAERESQDRRAAIETFREGRDEMNLAEFPLAAVSDRFLDGKKTIVFSDEVWDENRREMVPRSLTVSGSDRYGLPTAKDDDVLLACVQLSGIGDFHSREVHFSRYELLKLLRWKDESKYYHRLSVSLRRWKGVTIYSDRAFYDHARKSWVNRDFGVLDNLYVYEREESEKVRAPASSWFVWNEVLFESFRSGYLKKLDWDLYCRLEDPVAKRLYRFLDKRFYHRDRLVFDLGELAFNKVRVSPNYNTAQVKRALMAGIRELEALWELRPMEPEERFRKVSHGKWEVVFSIRQKRKAGTAEQVTPEQKELVSRGVTAEVARGLIKEFPAEKVNGMLQLFDWYRDHGQAKGPGFLVAGIKSKEDYVPPVGFAGTKHGSEANSRKRPERELRKRVRVERQEGQPSTIVDPFSAFWAALGEGAQRAFENAAIAAADPMKRDGYGRAQAGGGVLLEQYRRVILRDHFQRLGQASSGSVCPASQGE